VGSYISLRKLQRIILAQIQLFSDELLDEELLEAGIDPFSDFRQIKEGIESEIVLLKRRIEENQSSMKESYILKLRNNITEKEYIDSMIGISDEKNRAENRIADLTRQLAEIEKKPVIAADKQTLVAKYKRNKVLTKDMVDALIDYIEIGKMDPVTKETPVVIHWSF
jgi:hypothetical protein